MKNIKKLLRNFQAENGGKNTAKFIEMERAHCSGTLRFSLFLLPRGRSMY